MKLSELKLIEYLQKKIKAKGNIRAGIGDDCAVIQEGKRYYLLTSDLFIEHVHFRRSAITPRDIGKRAVSRALSDIAACCGMPRYILISAGIPSYVSLKEVKAIISGAASVARSFGASIIGGDTAQARKLFLDVFILGESRRPLLRSGAKTGDYIFVTAPLGARQFDQPFTPRLKEAQYLARFNVHAMIDISDGLAVDLCRILRASKKGAYIDKDAVPVTNNFNDIYRGEDYELLFTVDRNEPKLNVLMKKFYCVGRIKGKAFGYYMKDGRYKRKVPVKGYLHF